MKVVHVITGLPTGGAEMMLFKLLASFQGGGPDGEVLSLLPEEEMASRIRALGVPVRSANMSGPLSLPARMGPLARMIRESRADLVHCWMYHANLLGGLAAKRAGRRPILWGIRQSNLDPVLSKKTTRLVAWLGARLSRVLPDRIVYVSDAAQAVHRRMGYRDRGAAVIPNGFDPDVFKPDSEARRALRGELGLTDDSLLVGLVARFDPQKDHETFLRAAAALAEERKNVFFILAGRGTDGSQVAIRRLIERHALHGRVYGLGLRTDMPRVTAALDVAVSSSAFGEGFSNAIGEALACAVPAVVTDVGDSGDLAGEAGYVVPPRDPKALAAGIEMLLNLPLEARAGLGARGRRKMVEEYGLAAIAARYRNLYEDVVKARRIS